MIVIPCLNEQPFIDKLLNYLIDDLSIEASSKEPLVIVADGGSTDGTQDVIEGYAAKYECIKCLNNPYRLQSCGVNLAINAYAEEVDYLIRLDVHADYPKNYVTVLLQEAEINKSDSVVVSMDTQAKRSMQAVIAAAQNSVLGNGGSGHRNSLTEGRWIDHGHHALMRVDAFKQVGGYDENFSHNEDAELDYRLRQAGFNIWLTAKTNIVYYPRETLLALFRQYKGYGKGRSKNILKHGVIPKFRQLIPISIFPLFILCLLGMFFWPLVIPFSVWLVLSLVVGCLVGHKTLKENGFNRYLVGVAAITMHFSWSVGFCIGCFNWVARKKFIKGNG